MCGVAGYIFRNGKVDQPLIAKMTDVMQHRGPDASGTWISPDKHVALGHRRLSIIDLSSNANQPMLSKNRPVVVSFNGEIYNYKEIRRELVSQGCQFRTESDTEVLLEAYCHWGVDCFSRFDGMFAVAIYDTESRRLVLARDRVGKKPLYYFKTHDTFAFASEIPALLLHPSFQKNLNPDAINEFFTFGYISNTDSVWRNVHRLPPGSILTFQLESWQHQTCRYWELPPPNPTPIPIGDLVDVFENVLEEALRIRLRSDVPIGAFLSGGLDSSIIVAMLARQRQIKTYSVGFGNRNDELPHAKLIADHFGTEHHELHVGAAEWPVLEMLIRHIGEPFGGSSLIPTYILSKATKEHVTVALSGDGGDELFGGYKSYPATMLNAKLSQMVPSTISHGIDKLLSHYQVSGRVARNLRRVAMGPLPGHMDRVAEQHFNRHRRDALFSDDLKSSLTTPLETPERRRIYDIVSGPGTLLDRLTRCDFNHWMVDSVLVKVDRASMASSLEVRCPLLDHHVVEFAYANMGCNLRFGGMTRKRMLQLLGQKILPKSFNYRRKQGFGAPVASWFREPKVAKIVKELLLDQDESFFKKSTVTRCLDDFASDASHGQRIFLLTVFNLWRQNFGI